MEFCIRFIWGGFPWRVTWNGESNPFVSEISFDFYVEFNSKIKWVSSHLNV